jgi:hypothetical protein
MGAGLRGEKAPMSSWAPPLSVREGGVIFTPALPPDLRLLEFLAEVADLSARGGDVRGRIVG